MEQQALANNLVRIFFATRRLIIESAVILILLTAAIYWFSPELLSLLEVRLNQRLVFFGVAEPIVSLLKLSFFASLTITAPWLTFRLGQVLADLFALTRKFTILFTMGSILLFYSGVLFCYMITLPFGINFLLSFGSQALQPVISIERFVDFVVFFLGGFGLIFQLPLIMVIAAKLGLCNPCFFSEKRRYAVLVIAILAAMLTPTPDVVNMALMGIPLYLLYEAGIVLARMAGS